MSQARAVSDEPLTLEILKPVGDLLKIPPRSTQKSEAVRFLDVVWMWVYLLGSRPEESNRSQ